LTEADKLLSHCEERSDEAISKCKSDSVNDLVLI
jgi:hypothetical protein